jgi:RNA polymerase sigma factor (sigma-70 family)
MGWTVGGGRHGAVVVDSETLKRWFSREVLPLEPALMRFLRRNWRDPAEFVDLRQDIYVRVYDAAREALPLQTKAFLFATARNHLINRARRSRVISIELVADLESLSVAVDMIVPDRHATAREELRRVQAGLDRLPPRCREVIMLRKIEGLSQREVAARMGIGEDTVERQMVQGMRALVDFMVGGTGRIRRAPAKSRQREREEP